MAPMAPQELQARIQARARDFDVPALLVLFDHLGIPRTSITFRGNPVLGPQPTLVHAIEITGLDPGDGDGDGYGDGDRLPVRAGHEHAMHVQAIHVIVTLNIGLLSCRSPLPSYFQKLLLDIDTGAPLLALLRVIDAQLLATRCAGYRPELELSAWQPMQQDVLRTAAPGSPSTLHALFRHVYPELDVSVRRVHGERVLRTESTRLGHAVLGNSAFGSQASATVSAIEVLLRCHEPISRAGIPWAREARTRLHTVVFDLLRDTDLHLTVYLVMLDQGSYAQLDGESYIGYDPLRGGPAVPHRVLLFRGPLPASLPA